MGVFFLISELNVAEMGRCSPPQCGRGSDITEKLRELDSIQDIPELRKLVGSYCSLVQVQILSHSVESFKLLWLNFHRFYGYPSPIN